MMREISSRTVYEVKLRETAVWHLSVYHPTDETVRNEPLLSNVSLLFVCCCHQEEKKRIESHSLARHQKKKNKTKLKDTNSLSEGSLRIVNERAQFSGGKKRRDNLCHAKVAASTENDNDYNSIRVYLRREKLYQFLISNGAVQRNAFLSQCWNWYRFLQQTEKLLNCQLTMSWRNRCNRSSIVET